MGEPNPMDEPEGEAMELVMPFIVCTSQGGPYDDDSFTAGFLAGQIDQALKIAAAANCETLSWPIFRMALAPQVDLIAMRYGFAAVVEASDAYPEWGELVVTRGLR